ncbi:GNAT superfamily N-acetyltransferase [Kribbella aluminosa]|uniref:GNAT superfamily N-acetyltransferase n=1 Tax=Kribbella aluminosa TaxID=416017 RepID=A0ABS4UYL8_9ACTN|nr:GNAT family N-acetyltransferase [Kribbella aluminosa]MBP2356725.1 GNAT superfamily N-acetyltransferase [Kribbella aluminosa]
MILIRRADAVRAPRVPGVVLRPPGVEDTQPLAQLYYEAYDPGASAATAAEALEDIALTFEGHYGVLDLDLSWLAWSGNDLVGAMLIVERAPWADTPDCPFIIELFIAPGHRRRGIARLLLARCAATTVALRVDDGNAPALALYRDLGFRDG